MFNEILSEITERDYTFNPKAIMVDKYGANYCTIKQVLGVNFMTSKVVSCQMHYKNDVNRVSFRIRLSYRDLFKSICYGMYFIATLAHYNEWKQWLEEIANLFSDISHWVAWWDSRELSHFLLSDIFATQMSHLLKVVMECSSTWHNYGYWRLHEMTHLLCSWKIQEFKSFIAQASTSSVRRLFSLT